LPIAQQPSVFEVRHWSENFTGGIADITEQIPTVKRLAPQTVSYQAGDYLQGYRLLRVLYRYLRADWARLSIGDANFRLRGPIPHSTWCRPVVV